MRLKLFSDLLSVPTQTYREDRMVEFILEHVKARGEARCGRAWTDRHKNVYILKGNADVYPCMAAHIDGVQPFERKVYVHQMGDIFVGSDDHGKQAGVGGDDKTGIMVCLEALERLDQCAIAFFAKEEYGCQGAFAAIPAFFKQVGYLIEWDCPSRNLFSYTCSGVRLFENNGEFIQRALPLLQEREVKWQHHPYTDVMAIRKRFPISCMNIASGYYNWHTDREYVRISDTAAALELGLGLVAALGNNRYPFAVHHHDQAAPLVEIGPLEVRDNALVEG